MMAQGWTAKKMARMTKVSLGTILALKQAVMHDRSLAAADRFTRQEAGDGSSIKHYVTANP